MLEKEEVDGKLLSKYQGEQDNATFTLYVDFQTKLPTKVIRKNEGSQTTFYFKFSRINEITQDEVTLPKSAKAFSRIEEFLGDRFLKKITDNRPQPNK